MSTKNTLAYDPTGHRFHFYKDYYDEGKLFLEIRKSCGCFETITIPPEIWEAIRQIPYCSFQYAFMPDKDIEIVVTDEVDERLAEYEAHKNDSDRAEALYGLMGSAVYGDISESREAQIANGIKYYSAKREHERDIVWKSKEFKTYPDKG